MSCRIRTGDLDTIRRHGEGTYPHECCGVIIGRFDADGSTVVRLEPADNERDDSRHNRFLITPETLLRADRAARADGLDVIGFYHSHPDAPARPSEFDREHAWPTYVYIIVGVAGGTAGDVTAWTLATERTHFNPEPLETTAEV